MEERTSQIGKILYRYVIDDVERAIISDHNYLIIKIQLFILKLQLIEVFLSVDQFSFGYFFLTGIYIYNKLNLYILHN